MSEEPWGEMNLADRIFAYLGGHSYAKLYGDKNKEVMEMIQRDIDSRVAPVASRPKLMVPWDRPEDVPMPVCWARDTTTGLSPGAGRLVLAMSGAGEKVIGVIVVSSSGINYESVNWGTLATGYQYSTDGKTWRPCTKEVAS